MSAQNTSIPFVQLLRRLGAADNDVRYAAFLEAESLPDDDLLRLVEKWNTLTAGNRPPAERVCVNVWIGLLILLLLNGVVDGRHRLALGAGALLLASRLLLLWRNFGREGEPLLSASSCPIERSLARLLARRNDTRLLAVCTALHDGTKDEQSRQYVRQALQNLLPRMKSDEHNLLRPHQRFLAKILLRPLRDVRLTLGVLSALEAAGDRRGLAYVRSLAFVFERDLEAWERACKSRETTG